jgi:hypothetical protein
MKEDLKEYMETEIGVMLQEIGPCVNTDSEYFTQKAIEWIQKNAAGFRMAWDKKSCKIVKRTKRRAVKQHDME